MFPPRPPSSASCTDQPHLASRASESPSGRGAALTDRVPNVAACSSPRKSERRLIRALSARNAAGAGLRPAGGPPRTVHYVRLKEGARVGTIGSPTKKFTEPVALSSTQPADRPLPRRAFELRFDLIALRARCRGQAMGLGLPGQGRRSPDSRNLRRISPTAGRAPRKRRIPPCAALSCTASREQRWGSPPSLRSLG